MTRDDITDKKLLELAAKAAGMTIETHYVDGGASVWEGERHHSDWIPDWNPLDDDGDALRLAVKLGLILDCEYQSAMPHDRQGVGEDWLDGDGKDDPYAATRRAIVRAAAEIGRSMK